jgi:hypothetical protein
LEQLRLQRAQALNRFESSQGARLRRTTDDASEQLDGPRNGGEGYPPGARIPLPTQLAASLQGRRERNHLRHYARDSGPYTKDIHIIDTVSTSSDSTKSTPSKKARELRTQLDEALEASRVIRLSHEKLGTELRTFKSRFYQKNSLLEDQAFQAMGDVQAHHHMEIVENRQEQETYYGHHVIRLDGSYSESSDSES